MGAGRRRAGLPDSANQTPELRFCAVLGLRSDALRGGGFRLLKGCTLCDARYGSAGTAGTSSVSPSTLALLTLTARVDALRERGGVVGAVGKRDVSIELAVLYMLTVL